MSYPILSTLVVVAVLATMITESVYPKAKNNDDDDDDDNNDNMKAKARAIQNGESLDTENEGVVGSDVDCVGGIDKSGDASYTKCYFLADGTPTPQYNTQNVAVQQGSASSCPSGVEIGCGDECFTITFDASYFITPGHYRFVVEFYNGAGRLIDLVGIDYKVHSFLVIPESGVGAIALVTSSLGAMGGYYFYRSHEIQSLLHDSRTERIIATNILLFFLYLLSYLSKE